MSKITKRTVWFENETGDRLRVELTDEGGELLGTVRIENIRYHVFVAERHEIGSGGNKLILDRDPGYSPQTNESGSFILMAPYSA